MIQKAFIAFCTCLVSSFAYAQTDAVQTMLQKIEQNNVELKAFDQYKESKTFALKSTNVLPNPQVGAYYLPFGNSLSGNYTEVQVSQSFEFPTVYTARKELITEQQEQLGLEYKQKRQQILLQSKTAIQEAIALNKLQLIEEQRLGQAKKLFDQNQKLFDSGQIGILELNKAKVAYMKLQFALQKIKTEKQNVLLSIKNLNGGESIDVNQADFEIDFLLPGQELIWQEKIDISPTANLYAQAENVANQQINLTKTMALPHLTAGYNYQGFSGDNVHGVYAGVGIPLWGNKLRKNAAQANYGFAKSNTTTQMQSIKSEFDTQYNKYQSLLKVYNEYNNTLQALNSENLLLKAYQLGEISFSEYFIELEFYHNANDALLDMEKQLHLIKTQILDYKL